MSVHAPVEVPSPVGDVGELYRSLARRLEQIVRIDVRAPDPLIEDACQFAWDRLLQHRHRVRRETALSWLATTAVREAFKLLRRDSRCLSLDAAIETGGEQPLLARSSDPDEVVQHRERLDCVRLLPERQQRVLWLHALGLSYAEIAVHTGDTVRTVERQLMRAKRTVRQVTS